MEDKPNYTEAVINNNPEQIVSNFFFTWNGF